MWARILIDRRAAIIKTKASRCYLHSTLSQPISDVAICVAMVLDEVVFLCCNRRVGEGTFCVATVVDEDVATVVDEVVGVIAKHVVSRKDIQSNRRPGSIPH